VKLTVKEFQTHLDEEVRATCAEFNWNFDSAPERGWAFQLWCGRLIAESNPSIDTDPEDSLLKSRDLGVDVVLEDSENKQLYLTQCKFTGTSRSAKSKPAEEGDILQFATLHERLRDRKWVREHASSAALEYLADYADRIKSGWTPVFSFITTGSITDRCVQGARTRFQEYSRSDLPAVGVLYDFEKLKDFYIRAKSIDEDIPEEVDIDLPADVFFLKQRPRKTLIASVKGTWLRHLYDRYKETLFSWNIRGYMGNRGLNSEIADTAENHADDFFYYNNGVSAICKSFEVIKNHLHIEKLQVINGAQTIGSLSKAAPKEELDILFRLTETGDINIEKGINSQIIKFNNTQNVIKVSDFRSNDEIQKWLEQAFRTARNYPTFKAVSYLRKRGRHAGAAKALKLEELAKLLYVYNFPPMRIYESPRDLWTLAGYGGVYEQIFGMDGRRVDSWSEERFQEALLALAISQRVESLVAQEKREGRPFMHRLRFHLLALMGIATRNRLSGIATSALLKNAERFDEHWNWAWPEARRTLIQDFTTFCEEGDMTLHAYMRSEPRWKTNCKIFGRSLGLAESAFAEA